MKSRCRHNDGLAMPAMTIPSSRGILATAQSLGIRRPVALIMVHDRVADTEWVVTSGAGARLVAARTRR
jgi:hypothetical protein